MFVEPLLELPHLLHHVVDALAVVPYDGPVIDVPSEWAHASLRSVLVLQAQERALAVGVRHLHRGPTPAVRAVRGPMDRKALLADDDGDLATTLVAGQDAERDQSRPRPVHVALKRFISGGRGHP